MLSLDSFLSHLLGPKKINKDAEEIISKYQGPSLQGVSLRAGNVSQVVECLASMLEELDFKPQHYRNEASL